MGKALRYGLYATLFFIVTAIMYRWNAVEMEILGWLVYVMIGVTVLVGYFLLLLLYYLYNTNRKVCYSLVVILVLIVAGFILYQTLTRP